MATSSIYADFTIRDNDKADAFADACEWSLKHQPPKSKRKVKILQTNRELDTLFKQLNKKYGMKKQTNEF